MIDSVTGVYGCRSLCLACHAYFIVLNILCTAGKSKAMMLLGQFMAGLGGSVGIALTSPIMSDIWKIEERGKAMALSMFISFFRASMRLILGGYMTQQVSWHWLSWKISIFDVILLAISYFIREKPYTPRTTSSPTQKTSQNSFLKMQSSPKRKYTVARLRAAL